MSVLSKDNNDLALEALESITLLKNKVWVGTKYNLIWRLHVNTLIHNFKMSLTLILFWPSPQNPITSAFGSGLVIRKF